VYVFFLIYKHSYCVFERKGGIFRINDCKIKKKKIIIIIIEKCICLEENIKKEYKMCTPLSHPPGLFSNRGLLRSDLSLHQSGFCLYLRMGSWKSMADIFLEED
jgi:hypothetical protein